MGKVAVDFRLKEGCSIEGDLVSSSAAVAAGFTIVPTVGTLICLELCCEPTFDISLVGALLKAPPLTVLRRVVVVECERFEVGDEAGELGIGRARAETETTTIKAAVAARCPLLVELKLLCP